MKKHKILSVLSLSGLAILVAIGLSGCYTEVATRPDTSNPEDDYGYQSGTDTTGAGIVNNYYFNDDGSGYSHYRLAFRFYYPSWSFGIAAGYPGYYDPWWNYDYGWGGGFDPWFYGAGAAYYNPWWYNRPWYGYGGWIDYPGYPYYYTTTRYRMARDFGSTRGGVTRGAYGRYGAGTYPVGTTTGRSGDRMIPGAADRAGAIRGGATRTGDDRSGLGTPAWGGVSRDAPGTGTVRRGGETVAPRPDRGSRTTRAAPATGNQPARSPDRNGRTVRKPRSQPAAPRQTPKPSVTPPARQSPPPRQEGNPPRNEGSGRERPRSFNGGNYNPPATHYSPPPRTERPSYSPAPRYSPPPRESSGGSRSGGGGSRGEGRRR